ncbi:MAG: hypothetical protein MJD61_01345 [Proteobacteria bacterium]|nr:hypothetical protein [Pseudomonadota bacterium]
MKWGRGKAPYRDFRPEYPPGAVAAFMAPYLTHGRTGYGKGFRSMMLLADLGCFLTVLRWLSDRRRSELVTGACVYLVYSALLFPVIYKRYDLLPALCAALGLYYVDKGKGDRKAGLLLGLGASLKLWPAVLLCAPGVSHWQRKQRRKLAYLCLGALAGLLGPFALVAHRAGFGSFDFLGYHAERGLQIASTWGSAVLCLDALGWTEASIYHGHGAYHLRGGLAQTLASATMPATVFLGLLPVVLMWWRRRSVATVVVGPASVLGMMLGSNVLSGQFMLWLAPFVPLLFRAKRWCVVLLVLAALATTLFYPVLAMALPRGSPAYGVALVSIATRNLLLVIAYGLLVTHIVRGPARSRS